MAAKADIRNRRRQRRRERLCVFCLALLCFQQQPLQFVKIDGGSGLNGIPSRSQPWPAGGFRSAPATWKNRWMRRAKRAGHALGHGRMVYR